MNYLSVENIGKAFGEQLIFENLTFGLAKGDKTALIARNGKGKTTLLKILAGIERVDSGEFTFRNGIRIAFLEQVPDLDDTLTIQELILSGHSELLSLIRQYEEEMEKQGSGSGNLDTIETLSAEMDRQGGWDYEARLNRLLDLFRIYDRSQLIGKLSGGEKKRLALALILLDEPEFLILDEPTNHLDVEMIEWLEQYLSQANLTILMVTHDRYFLDRVCNRILELDHGKLFSFQGNYEYFLQKRSEREAQTQTEAYRAGQLMKQELDWLRRAPKARTHKSKSRIDAFDGIKEKAMQVEHEDELRLQVDIPRIGGKILDVTDISKSYGKEQLIKDFSFKFSKGERIGILGRNGCGKSTLLNIITGKEEADSGTMDLGETMVFGYYTQKGMSWKKDERVIDAVKEIAEIVRLKNGRTLSASAFLEHFLFPVESQYKQISKLSGGELRRLHLLTVLIKNPNFLILDEPTNDLDLFALNKLEEFLLNFPGCLLVVSHDRYFLDKLSDHMFIFEENGVIKDHYGTYAEYKKEKEKRDRAVSGKAKKEVPAKKAKSADKSKVKTKLSYKEKLEYESLEPEIEALEQEKAALESELATGNLEYTILTEKSERISELIALIEEKTLRWMELGEVGLG